MSLCNACFTTAKRTLAVSRESLVSNTAFVGLPRYFLSLVSPNCFRMNENGSQYSLVAKSKPVLDIYLYMDAVPVGQEEHLDDLAVSGQSSAFLKEQRVNVLELRAVWMAPKPFRQAFTKNHILLSFDNTFVSSEHKKGENTLGRLPFMATWLPAWVQRHMNFCQNRLYSGS